MHSWLVSRWTARLVGLVLIALLILLAIPVLGSFLTPLPMRFAEFRVDATTLHPGDIIPIVGERCVWEPLGPGRVFARLRSSLRNTGDQTFVTVADVDSFVEYGCVPIRSFALRIPFGVALGTYRIESTITTYGRWRTDTQLLVSNTFQVVAR